MADDNVFDSPAPALSMSDFAPLEKVVGHVLPESFKRKRPADPPSIGRQLCVVCER